MQAVFSESNISASQLLRSAIAQYFERQRKPWQVSAVTVVDPESATGILPFDRDASVRTHYTACSTLQASRVIKTQLSVLYRKKACRTRERARLGLTARADLLVHFDMRLFIVEHKLVYTQQLFDSKPLQRSIAPFKLSRTNCIRLMSLCFIWPKTIFIRCTGGEPSTVNNLVARPATSSGYALNMR